MKTTTIYSEIINEVFNKGSMGFSQVLDMAAKYTDEILSTDEPLWGVEKRLSGYGTWTARISFANEYTFGKKIVEMLKGLPCVVTHDEDAEFCLSDWEEDIEEALVELIQSAADEIKAELGNFLDEFNAVEVDADGPTAEQNEQLDAVVEKYTERLYNLQQLPE